MTGSYLLDTNIVIALFAGEQAVLNHLRDTNEVYIKWTLLSRHSFGKSQGDLEMVRDS